MSTDHRSRPRRRGEVLVDTILEATLAEVAEHGYAALSMERVARRAGASKASLYRRWPGTVPLVVDAVYRALPEPAPRPAPGGLRAELVAVLQAVVRQLEGPAGVALRGLFGEALRDPAVAARVHELGRSASVAAVTAVVRRAVERGECPAEVLGHRRRLEAGPALLRARFLLDGAELSDAYAAEVVDQVVLPLLRAPV